MQRRHPKRTVIASLVISSGLGVALTPRSASAADDDTTRIVITGSNVPTTRDAAAVSVTELDRDKIDRAGVNTDVLEILRKGVPSFQGRSNTGATNANNTNQNTAGGAQLQLRNLDTLILVNGRRVAISGIAAIGGKAFVNTSQIPAAAIERIEVLSDGSSAIYGSDAIGGVVNLILKSNFDGIDIGARYGSASDYKEHGAFVTVGAKRADFSITGSLSVSHTDPLYQNKRSFSTPIVGRVAVVPGTIGGATPAILNPTLNTPSATNPVGNAATAPNLAALIANGTYSASTTAANAAAYDISQFQTLMLKQDQVALSINGSANLIAKTLVAFADVQYSNNRSFTQMLPVATTVTVPQNAAFNPIAGNVAGVNFADWALPKQVSNGQSALRLTGGLRGELSDRLRWEAAFVQSENHLDQQQANLLFRPNIPLAIAGGYDANGNLQSGGKYSRVYANYATGNPFVIQPALDPFARAAAINPASLANLYGSELISTASRLESVDGSLSGSVADLPAGRIDFAVGLAARRETLSSHTDDNGHNTGPGAQQWLGGTFADAFEKSRRVDAAYLEIRLPVASSKWALPGANALDLIAAVRQEKYSDAGNASSPKLGFRWQPVDRSLTIRGSYSKSFTAPTLYAEYGPTATRLVGSGVIQTVFGLANPGLQGQDGNNPNLLPSKANTSSLNIAFKPTAVPGLSMSLEYSAVDQKGFPGGIGFTNILQSVDQSGSASPFAGNVAKGNFPGLAGATPFTNPGELGAYLRADPNNSLNVYAIDRFFNLGGVRVRSFNATAEYAIETQSAGLFTIGTIGTIFKSYKFQALPYQKFYEYAGTATNGGTGVQGTLPKYRFYSSLDWQLGAWNATLSNTYVSSVTDIGAGGIVYETSTTLKPTPVARYMSWDLRAAYRGESVRMLGAKSWTVAVGVNNVANKMPPLAPQAFTDNNADVASYSPLGRMVYATAQMTF